MIERDFSLRTDGLSGADVIFVLSTLAKKHNCSLLKDNEPLFSAEHCIAIRDHMGGSTNALIKFDQGVKTFCPMLRMFPGQLAKVISKIEKQSVICSKLVKVTDMVITKSGNKRGVRNFYYCTRPCDLLAQILRKLFMEGSFEESSTFSSLVNKLLCQ